MIGNFKRIQKRPGANAIGRVCARLGAVLAACACVGALPASPIEPFALRDGESLTYSVRWGLIPFVGRIKISAESIGGGRGKVLRVTTTTATIGLARSLFPFDGRGESVYDAKSGLLISTSEWSTYRRKDVKNSVVFDYGRQMASYSDDIHPEKSCMIPMPPGDPSDLILALIRTRNWNLAIGQQRKSLVIFEDQFYPLTIRAEDIDYVFTALGLYRTTVLVPRMEGTPLLGMFKRGSTVRVWIETDDDLHLPVRFEVGFKFGAGTATLIEYQPPK